MDGKIRFDSTVGKGSAFTFEVDFELPKKTMPVFDKNLLKNLTIGVFSSAEDKKLFFKNLLPSLGAKEVLYSDPNDSSAIIKYSDFCIFDENFPDNIDDENAFFIVLTNKRITEKKYGNFLYTRSSPLKTSGIINLFKSVLSFDLAGDSYFERKKTAEEKNVYLKDKYGEKIIAVAEDNLINIKVVESFLKTIGIKHDIFKNGRDLLIGMLQKKYDLIFMDCQMPVINGYEATSRLRKKAFWDIIDFDTVSPDYLDAISLTPVVAMTAHSMEGDREKCLEIGMDDYISKPLKKSDIEEILEKWL